MQRRNSSVVQSFIRKVGSLSQPCLEELPSGGPHMLKSMQRSNWAGFWFKFVEPLVVLYLSKVHTFYGF
jgi:hypothetical protein